MRWDIKHMKNALNYITIGCCFITIITMLSVKLTERSNKEEWVSYNHTTQVSDIYRERDDKTEIKCGAPYYKRNMIEQIELKKDKKPIAYIIHSPTDKIRSGSLYKYRRYNEEEKIYIRYHQDHQTQVKVYKEYLTPQETAFQAYLDYSGIYLTLDSTTINNTGNYNCTIKYVTNEITTEVTKLEIFAPPGDNIITDDTNHTITSIYGPLRIGDDIKLRCRPSSGTPIPVVSWKIQDNKPTRRRLGIDTIEIKNITRKDHDKRLTCFSSNSIHNRTFQQATSTKLCMILPPTSIQITQDKRILREGTKHEFSCEIVEANPEPRIKWKMNNRIWKSDKILITSRSTIARLQIILISRYHQNPLQCEVIIPGLTEKFTEAKVIRMEFKPKCEKELTQVIINQGKKYIRLTCPILANPANKLRVTWKGNGSVTDELKAESTIDINITNHVDLYETIIRCKAANQIGEQEGNCLFQFKYTEKCIFYITRICITASRVEAAKWMGIIVLIIILPISINEIDHCIKKRHTRRLPIAPRKLPEDNGDQSNTNKQSRMVTATTRIEENNGYMKMMKWTPEQEKNTTTTIDENGLTKQLRFSNGDCEQWQDLTEQLNQVMINLKRNKIETALIVNELDRTEPDDNQDGNMLSHNGRE